MHVCLPITLVVSMKRQLFRVTRAQVWTVKLIIIEVEVPYYCETYYHNIFKCIIEVYYNHCCLIETYNYLEVIIKINNYVIKT